ncbi:HdeD family acid-resistance protein [uncultured Hymenobacter sp.]|uniref:HdeD family acid-resistance protein n=1 Tax=uncultured Hymenobacter sp. TaxID=170016 RepID=UPI0035CB0843
MQITAESVLHSNWWVLLLRGFAAVVFGLLTFLMPGLTLLVLVSLFGGYYFINGVLTLVAAFRGGRHQPRWWSLAVEGVASLLAGIITLLWPGVTSLALLYVVAAWAIITGVLQIATGIRLRKQITNEWVLIVGGLLSVGFGILLLLVPVAGAVVVAWWVGCYAFAFGILLSVLAFRLRRQTTARPINHMQTINSQSSPTM